MIRAFLFDKDGTLIDFKSIWLPIAQRIADKVCQQYSSRLSREKLLEIIGVIDEEIDGTGILASKTIVELAQVWHVQLHNPPELNHFIEEIEGDFYKAVDQEITKVQLLPGVKETLQKLKQQGFILGVATSDSKLNTIKMLEYLQVHELFDYIGTEDGIIPPKPDKAHMEAFCSQHQLRPQQVAMVGDTLCDMTFGKNSGALSIGVLSGTGNEENLKDYADYIIPSVASLKEKMEWEQ